MKEKNNLKQIVDFRKAKLEDIRSKNIVVYPYNYRYSIKIEDLVNDDSVIDQNHSIAGRIVSLRKMGKSMFVHIQDREFKQQLYFHFDNLADNQYNLVAKKLDIGDIIGVNGDMFKTKLGEITMKVYSLSLLSKNLYPLPNIKEKDGESFFSFEDKELRYRNRHIDFIVNPRRIKIFEKRALIIKTIRSFLDNLKYLEVETPVLQPIYGGASARPFTTYHNTLDEKLYLRIADELYLKRLIIGGINKVYELSKNFRNEGMDRNHNPEFTAVEFYQAYSDVYDMADITENLIKTICDNLNITKVNYRDLTIDFSTIFKREKFFDLLSEKVGDDVFQMDFSKLKSLCKKLNIDIHKSCTLPQILDKLFSDIVEPTLVSPTFVFDYPISLSPLAKCHRDNTNLVERFELFFGGMEVANSFSELNDPQEQIERFETQKRLIEGGDNEAQVMDNDFINALSIGMPPTGGVGIGIDRLVMLLLGLNSIRDVIIFPAMRKK